MSDPALLTLLSVVISALITATGTVIAAYISKKGTIEQPRTAKIFRPPNYHPSPKKGFWNKRSIAIIVSAFIVITFVAGTLLLSRFDRLASNSATPTTLPSITPTIDPCKNFVSKVYKGEKVHSANVLDKIEIFENCQVFQRL